MTYRDVVIEEKEYPEDEPEWKRKCNPLSVEFPKVNEPGTPMRRLKRSADGECQRVRIVETAPICHGRGRDKGKRHAVIGTEAANMSMKKCRTGKKLEKERGDKHQEGESDRDECRIR